FINHNNSCFMDAVLYTMFANTNLYDLLLLGSINIADTIKQKCATSLQKILRVDIVNTLRTTQSNNIGEKIINSFKTLFVNCIGLSTTSICNGYDSSEFIYYLLNLLDTPLNTINIPLYSKGDYKLYIEKTQEVYYVLLKTKNSAKLVKK